MTDTDKKMIAALLRERDGLASIGKTDRVAQVDEQLKLYGYQDGAPDPRRQAPQGRSTTPPQATVAPDAGELEGLRAEAEKAGVTVDKRWGADRLKQEIADVGKSKA